MSKPVFHIAVTTYNRPEMLRRLIRNLARESATADVSVSLNVYDDGSEPPVSLHPELYVPAGHGITQPCQVWRREKNGGKRWFWSLVDAALQRAAAAEWDFLAFIQDDTVPVDDFFSEVIECWDALEHNRMVLNLLTDQQRKGKQQWTGVPPRRFEAFGRTFYQTQWVDMNFVARRVFVDAIDRILPVPGQRWERNPNLSSGVGRQLSVRLHHLDFRMYHPEDTLLEHGDHASVMFPGLRRTERLTT